MKVSEARISLYSFGEDADIILILFLVHPWCSGWLPEITIGRFIRSQYNFTPRGLRLSYIMAVFKTASTSCSGWYWWMLALLTLVVFQWGSRAVFAHFYKGAYRSGSGSNILKSFAWVISNTNMLSEFVSTWAYIRCCAGISVDGVLRKRNSATME